MLKLWAYVFYYPALINWGNCNYFLIILRKDILIYRKLKFCLLLRSKSFKPLWWDNLRIFTKKLIFHNPGRFLFFLCLHLCLDNIGICLLKLYNFSFLLHFFLPEFLLHFHSFSLYPFFLPCFFFSLFSCLFFFTSLLLFHLLSENILKFLLLICLTRFLLIIKSTNWKTITSWLILFQNRLWLVGVY